MECSAVGKKYGYAFRFERSVRTYVPTYVRTYSGLDELAMDRGSLYIVNLIIKTDDSRLGTEFEVSKRSIKVPERIYPTAQLKFFIHYL